MTIQEAIKLRDFYGGHVTLDELVQFIKGDKVHKCPQCNGSGIVQIKNKQVMQINEHQFITSKDFDIVILTDVCDLCSGDGYTKEKYVPRMVQDGWEVTK